MRVYFPIFALVTTFLVSGCSININTTQSPDLTIEQQEFIACEIWFEDFPPGGILWSPEVIDPNPLYEALNDRIQKLSEIEGLLALQIKRVLEENLKHEKIFEETGEVPYSTINATELIFTCDEILNGHNQWP
jgi:hypothetical protein